MDKCQDVNVGDPDCPMERLQNEFGVDNVISHLNAWQFLSSALKAENDQGILFRVNSPGAVRHSLVDTYSLKTQGASLPLLHKLDTVRIGINEYLTLKLLKMKISHVLFVRATRGGSISPNHTLSVNS